MWSNSTGSVSRIPSTIFLALTFCATSTSVTAETVKCENVAVYKSYISAEQNNEVLTKINNADSENAMLPEVIQKNMRKILLIASLKDNWNGNGALAFSAKLIDRVKQIVLSLVRQPEIFPTAAGSIQLEYDGDNDSYLEMEIFELGPAEIFRVNRDGSEECFKVDDDIESLNGLVASFYG